TAAALSAALHPLESLWLSQKLTGFFADQVFDAAFKGENSKGEVPVQEHTIRFYPHIAGNRETHHVKREIGGVIPPLFPDVGDLVGKILLQLANNVADAPQRFVL